MTMTISKKHFEKADIDFLKSQIDINDLANRLRIERPFQRGNYRCFNKAKHEGGDKNPSLSIGKGMFNCFACQIKGDAISLYEQVMNVDFVTAVEQLARDYAPNLLANNKAQPTKRLVDFNPPTITAVIPKPFEEPDPTQNILNEYEESLNRQPSNFHKFCLELGVTPKYLKDVGTATDGATLFWLFDSKNRPTSAQRRMFNETGNGDTTFYLFNDRPRPPFGFNEWDKKKPLIATESAKNAILGNWYLGSLFHFISVMSATGLTIQMAAWLKERGVETIYIHFDNDISGKDGTKKAAENLKIAGIKCLDFKVTSYWPSAPDKADIADFVIQKVGSKKNHKPP